MLKNKNDISVWLDSMDIKGYIIHDDLTVDVNGNVDLGVKKLQSIPVQFGVINGKFSCYGNMLTSLKGCPYKVNGFFNCSGNKLKSLKYCPKEVTEGFHCNNNLITSLKYCPQKVGVIFSCGLNPIKNLNGFTTQIKREFRHPIEDLNQRIPSFKEKYIKVLNEYDIDEWLLILTPKELNIIRQSYELKSELSNELEPHSKPIKKTKV